MAQGVAWAARRRQVPWPVVVPEDAPETKRSAIVWLGAQIVEVPFGRCWRAIEEARFDELEGAFIHPAQDESVNAGNATIGLESPEDLPEPDATLVPGGIASAVRSLASETSVYASSQQRARPWRGLSKSAGQRRSNSSDRSWTGWREGCPAEHVVSGEPAPRRGDHRIPRPDGGRGAASRGARARCR
jgi:threonine dehydratase